jgi:hypothetical protein
MVRKIEGKKAKNRKMVVFLNRQKSGILFFLIKAEILFGE